MKLLLLGVLLTFYCSLYGELTVELEGGQVWSSYNNVRIPDEGGTRISLTRDFPLDSTLYMRAKVSYRFLEAHNITLLLAPLQLEGSGTLDKRVFFDGVWFEPGYKVSSVYKFNSYRLGYRYDFYMKNNLEIGAGVVLKIRDAKIGLKNKFDKVERTNLGFVPLLNFRLLWKFHEAYSLIFDADALAAPQGRAEDILVAVQHEVVENFNIRLGYRMVEGGAAGGGDVFTFAWLHYTVFGFTGSFL